MKVTVLGGGTGISTVLRGLAAHKRSEEEIEITAVVATADDGGSSGRLRRERGGLAVGDLRSCLVALSPREARPLARVFRHRYRGSGGLAGHSVGNLILSALAEQEGDYLRALATAGKMLGTCGRVLPVSLQSLQMEGEAEDGRRLTGESSIGGARCSVRRVWLVPQDATPAPGVLHAIREADLLVVGPGSLFTSLLSVLLVPGVSRGVRECRGMRVLVANLMTQPGETLRMDLVNHLEVLDRHVGRGLVDVVLVNDAPLPRRRLRPYAERRSEPVLACANSGRTERFVCGPVVTGSGKIRHDPDRVAATLLALANGRAERTAAGSRQSMARRARTRLLGRLFAADRVVRGEGASR